MRRGVLALLCTVLVVGCGGRSSDDQPEPEGGATNSTTGSPLPEFPCGDPSRWGSEVWCWPAGRDALVSSEPRTEWELDAHGCGPAAAYDGWSIPPCGGELRCDVATPDLEGPGTCCFRYEIACKV